MSAMYTRGSSTWKRPIFRVFAQSTFSPALLFSENAQCRCHQSLISWSNAVIKNVVFLCKS